MFSVNHVANANNNGSFLTRPWIFASAVELRIQKQREMVSIYQVVAMIQMGKTNWEMK